MTGLAEYEAYLDKLDRCLYVRGADIVVAFSKPYAIPLQSCTPADALIERTLEFTYGLIEEDAAIVDYLAKRFIRLASAALGLGVDAEQMYKNHELILIDDAVLKDEGSTMPGSLDLRFENGVGKYAGRHFLKLQRSVDAESGVPVGALTVSRCMEGYPGHEQHAEVVEVRIVRTKTHLVFCLPPTSVWQFSLPGITKNGAWLHATRIALRHNFTAGQLGDIQTKLENLLVGINHSFLSVGNF